MDPLTIKYQRVTSRERCLVTEESKFLFRPLRLPSGPPLKVRRQLRERPRLRTGTGSGGDPRRLSEGL